MDSEMGCGSALTDSDVNLGNTLLFDDAALDAKTKEQSLTILANCVFLVNSTILKERKLLPDNMFCDYEVFDNVYGYTVNQADQGGSKLALKLRTCQKGIESERIHKLAIVVEEILNSDDVMETFIWTFSYDSTSSARAYITAGGKNTTAFNVDARNMKETCQQFCKMFSELKEIFKNLLPMPHGMVPSLRVAFRADEPAPEGFDRTNTFVNVDELTDVGHVSFPEKMKLHLQYHSSFHCGQVHSRNALLEDETSVEQIEGPRNETMHYSNAAEDFENQMPPVNEIDDFPDASIQNNNPESRLELDNELLSENNVHDAKVVPEMVDQQKTVSVLTKRSRSAKMTSQKTISEPANESVADRNRRKRKSGPSKVVTQECEAVTETNVPQKKKTSRRSPSTQKKSMRNIEDEQNSAVDDAMDGEQVQSAETDVIESTGVQETKDPQENDGQQPTPQEENKEDKMEVDQVQEEEAAEEQLASKSSIKFGRVQSLLEIGETQRKRSVAHGIANDQVSDKLISVRYGSTCSFAEKSKNKNNTPEVHDVQLQQPAKRFGRAASILSTITNTVAPIQEQSRRNSPNTCSKRKFGRVSSVLGLSEQSIAIEHTEQSGQMEAAVEEVASVRRYGRVVSLRSETVKKTKYGHSPSIRPK